MIILRISQEWVLRLHNPTKITTSVGDVDDEGSNTYKERNE